MRVGIRAPASQEFQGSGRRSDRWTACIGGGMDDKWDQRGVGSRHKMNIPVTCISYGMYRFFFIAPGAGGVRCLLWEDGRIACRAGRRPNYFFGRRWTGRIGGRVCNIWKRMIIIG